MSADPSGLRHVHRALLIPPLVAGGCVTLFCVLSMVRDADVSSELRLFQGLWSFLIFGGLIAVEYVTLQGSLRMLGNLSRGEGRGARSEFLEAARETQGLPERAARLHLILWVAGALGLSAAVYLWGGGSLRFAASSLVMSLAFAPLGALIVDLAALRPSRKVLLQLFDAARLTAEDRLRMLPVKARNLRRRLMMFTGMCAVTPTVLMAEMVLSKTLRALDALTEAHPVSSTEVLDVANTGTVLQAVLIGLGGLLGAVVVSVLTARALREPLDGLAAELQRMAAGDLRELRVIIGEDEMAAASAAIGNIQLQLTSALREMRVAGAGISKVTEELVQVSSQHEMGAAQQVASLVNTVATTEELARSAAQIADAASSVATLAQSTLRSAEDGRRSSETFVGAMERTKAENQAIADSVVRLNKRVQEIGKIVEFINGVADKSDLLALNAELEGTKAGEVGRGFSLVAAEMRRLAETVLSSTREISKLIDEVRDATHAAVMATEAGVKATDQGALLASQVSSNLFIIVQIADQTSDAVRAISLSTQQQQTGTDQLAEAMNAVLQGTDSEARATREASSANSDLFQLAQDLSKAVEQFRLTDEEQR